MRPRPSPRAARRCSPRRASRSTDYWDYTHRIFEWPDGALRQHDPGRRRRCHAAAAPGRARREATPACIAKPAQRGGDRAVRRDQRHAQARPEVVLDAPQRRCKGVTEETTTGVKRLYQMAQGRQARLPGHQRQRLGHQEQVRQPLRLPRVAGRWHQARHRRDGRRQGRRGRAATATSARARRRRCARCRRRCGSPRSTRSARCRRRWKATAS